MRHLYCVSFIPSSYAPTMLWTTKCFVKWTIYFNYNKTWEGKKMSGKRNDAYKKNIWQIIGPVKSTLSLYEPSSFTLNIMAFSWHRNEFASFKPYPMLPLCFETQFRHNFTLPFNVFIEKPKNINWKIVTPWLDVCIGAELSDAASLESTGKCTAKNSWLFLMESFPSWIVIFHFPFRFTPA